jgi:hypothetical protein
VSLPFLRYEAGISLNKYDGDSEMRVHIDEFNNLFILAWDFERESGEPRRREDFDGSLNLEAAENLRQWLNAWDAIRKAAP